MKDGLGLEKNSKIVLKEIEKAGRKGGSQWGLYHCCGGCHPLPRSGAFQEQKCR